MLLGAIAGGTRVEAEGEMMDSGVAVREILVGALGRSRLLAVGIDVSGAAERLADVTGIEAVIGRGATIGTREGGS